MATNDSENPPNHFVVLVPGFMGSRLRNRRTGEVAWLDVPGLLSDPFHLATRLADFFRQLQYPNDELEPDGIIDQIVYLPPFFKLEQYSRLSEALHEMGYTLGRGSAGKPAAYTFAYDWRQDNRISARQLGAFVQSRRARHPGAKAILIGHSNGGIVSRWYIEKEGGKEHVSRLFLMGSPWDGSPKSVKTLLEGPDIFLLRAFTTPQTQAAFRESVLSFPCFYQIIPQHFPFLREENGQTVDIFADPHWLENERQRQMLLDGQRFNQELGTTLSVDTLCFFGVKNRTTSGGVLKRKPDGSWARIDWEEDEEGDGTVPVRSALHPEASQKLPYSASHGDIYVVPPVLDKLEFELVSKYRYGVLREVIAGLYKVELDTDQDVYNPGETLKVWAKLAHVESGAPGYGAEVRVTLQLRQALRALRQPIAERLPEIELTPSDEEAGRYEGQLELPQVEGYYSLAARVTPAEGEKIELEEMILIEGSGRPGERDIPPAIAKGLPTGEAWRGTPEAPLPFSGPPPVFRSIDAPPATQPAQAEATPGERFLKAEISDHDPGQPLRLGQEANLAIFVDVERSEFAVVFDQARAFAPGEEIARLNVVLSTRDFLVYTRGPQELRVPRNGRSRNKVRFDIEPKRPGVGEITALLYKDNNFIQGIQLHLNVEVGNGPFASPPESLGRPLENVSAVQPRDALLFINEGSSGYDLTLVGAVAAEAHLPVSPQYLNKLIDQTRKALLEVVFLARDPSGVNVFPRNQRPPANVLLPYQTGFDIPEDVAQAALERLARAGWRLYQALFYGPDARQDANALGDRLRELAEKNMLKLQIVSKQFLLPWGLLYLAEDYDPEHIDPERFLGLRHIVEHIPLQQRMQVFDARIQGQPKLAVSLNVDTGIDKTTGRPLVANQLAYWNELTKASKKIDLVQRQSDQEWLKALRDPAADQILYFYGHAISQGLEEAGGPGGSSLSFSGQKRVTLDDMRDLAPERRPFPNSPLVFINACESSELSPLFYGGFMPYFTAKGARGMIGTECEVPAIFAAEWARRFFEIFLYEERPIGEVFLALRREFFFQHRNLLGLLYALYCDGDTTLAPRLS